MFYLIFFFFGASLGSFVNVVATRLHVAPIISSRSKCLSCGETLRAYDMIPLLSYLLLRGKCRTCKVAYGISSVIIEVCYGLIYVLLYHFVLSSQASLVIATWWLIYYTILFVILGVIALYDRAHTYIPVSYLLSYCIMTLVMLCIRYIHEPSYLTLLAPLLVALPFFVLWVLTRGRGLGFGDVMLFLGVGAFFGIEQGFAVLLISVWIGALVGVVMYLAHRTEKGVRLGSGVALPFVPFIVISFLIVLFTDIDVFSIASLFT